jgi:mono/diheme cytochrome c family protein
VGSGSGVWLSLDGDLGRWTDGQLTMATGAGLGADTRLVGSPSGDVWTISGSAVQRWSGTVASGAAGDEAVWNATVEPIFASVCSSCHSKPGSGKSSAGIDLSTYEAWTARRASIYTRVVTDASTDGAMPPPSSGGRLSDAQRAAIAVWAGDH